MLSLWPCLQNKNNLSMYMNSQSPEEMSTDSLWVMSRDNVNFACNAIDFWTHWIKLLIYTGFELLIALFFCLKFRLDAISIIFASVQFMAFSWQLSKFKNKINLIHFYWTNQLSTNFPPNKCLLQKGCCKVGATAEDSTCQETAATLFGSQMSWKAFWVRRSKQDYIATDGQRGPQLPFSPGKKLGGSHSPYFQHSLGKDVLVCLWHGSSFMLSPFCLPYCFQIRPRKNLGIGLIWKEFCPGWNPFIWHRLGHKSD